jgi:hypothetical protein
MKFLKAIALMIGGLLPLVMTVASGSAATVTFDWALTSNATPMNGGFPLLGSGDYLGNYVRHRHRPRDGDHRHGRRQPHHWANDVPKRQ